MSPKIKNRTITRDLTLILSIAISIMAVGLGVAYYQYSRYSSLKTFENRIAQTMNEYADIIALQLWEEDPKAIQEVSKAYLSSDYIAGIIVENSYGETTFNEIPSESSGLIAKSKQLFRNDYSLGSVKLLFSTQTINKNLQSIIQAIFITVGVVLIIIVGVNYLIMKLFLNRPLIKLIDGIDAIAGGNYKCPLQHVSHEDINAIVKAVNKMMYDIAVRESELKEAKDTADAANKTKSNFLMSMSHELRTPLNAVLASTAIINGNESRDVILELKRTIESSSYKLLETIEHILAFTKSNDGELKLKKHPFALGDALNSINTQFVNKGTKVDLIPEIELAGDTIPNNLIGDEKKIVKVINLLLENAAKFCRQKPNATLILKLLEKTSKQVCIQISLKDNGIGIPKEFHKKIFDSFYQTDASSTREFDGTGIGQRKNDHLKIHFDSI